MCDSMPHLVRVPVVAIRSHHNEHIQRGCLKTITTKSFLHTEASPFHSPAKQDPPLMAKQTSFGYSFSTYPAATSSGGLV
jgi:hypothetical protein